MSAIIRRIIKTCKAPSPVGPYSQAVVVDNTMYISGQIGLVPGTGQLIDGGLEAETTQTLENLKGVCEAAGVTLSNGEYTQETLRAFKSLKAYGYFQCGFVQTVYSHVVSSRSQVCFLKTKVTPSQKLGDKLHQAWVLVHKKDAFIVATHCTCKPGSYPNLYKTCSSLFPADTIKREVVKTTVLLQDINDWPAVNVIYGQYFSSRPPARAAYQVAALPKGARIEIEAVAVLGTVQDVE